MEKKRLDVFLVEKALCSTRSKAQELILAGFVSVNGNIHKKTGEKITESDVILLLQQEHRFVSRGGLKLEAALKFFSLTAQNKKALDIGASTGGFTQCLLEYGAEKVFCVDVGSSQLADHLRQNPRVQFWEQTNIRDFSLEQMGLLVDMVVVDVSFVSLKNIIPSLGKFLSEHGDLVLLVKPQFEVGKSNLNKKGVVRDPLLYPQILQELSLACKESGFLTRGTMESPIKGGDGNTEFFLHAVKMD